MSSDFNKSSEATDIKIWNLRTLREFVHDANK